MAFQQEDGAILGKVGGIVTSMFTGPIGAITAFVGLVIGSLTAQAKRNKEIAAGYYNMDSEIQQLFATNSAQQNALESQYLNQAQLQALADEQKGNILLTGIVIAAIILVIVTFFLVKTPAK